MPRKPTLLVPVQMPGTEGDCTTGQQQVSQQSQIILYAGR